MEFVTYWWKGVYFLIYSLFLFYLLPDLYCPRLSSQPSFPFSENFVKYWRNAFYFPYLLSLFYKRFPLHSLLIRLIFCFPLPSSFFAASFFPCIPSFINLHVFLLIFRTTQSIHDSFNSDGWLDRHHHKDSQRHNSNRWLRFQYKEPLFNSFSACTSRAFQSFFSYSLHALNSVNPLH